MNETEMRVICRGGFGVEFAFCGFGAGRDLFHRYLRFGVVTLYITTTPLYRLLKIMKATRGALGGKVGK